MTESAGGASTPSAAASSSPRPDASETRTEPGNDTGPNTAVNALAEATRADRSTAAMSHPTSTEADMLALCAARLSLGIVIPANWQQTNAYPPLLKNDDRSLIQRAGNTGGIG